MKQYFKTIYFSDHPNDGKTVTVAFNEPEEVYYSKLKSLSNEEIREIIGVQTYTQLSLFAETEERSVNQVIKRLVKRNLPLDAGIASRSVTFSSSRELPFQRWYPYIEGYSPEFVSNLINEYCQGATMIYDPFAGTGTTLFACDSQGIQSAYSEVNPLLQFLTGTKIALLRAPKTVRFPLAFQLKKIAKDVLAQIEHEAENQPLRQTFHLAFGDSRYFEEGVFSKILKLRTFLDKLKLENELLADIFTVAVLAALIPVSLLKKAGDVRFKTPAELEKEQVKLEDFLPKKLEEIAEDLENLAWVMKSEPEFLLSNAKQIDRLRELAIEAVITSPPYLNGTNYFRNTKLELWFLQCLRDEDDLRRFRDQALTCGINDVKSKSRKGQADLESPTLKKVLASLADKAYDKRIPVMVRDYFQEMRTVFEGLRTHLKPGAKILIDIGDSIFASVHVPTDQVLVEILETLGYELTEKKLLRKRRSRNQEVLSQLLLALEFPGNRNGRQVAAASEPPAWEQGWVCFKSQLPHQQKPFASRNWGHPNHSLCSYQGKLKPSIAHHLAEIFVPPGGVVLDPFSGVGTIPFEAALTGRKAFGLDISLPACLISSAKVALPDQGGALQYASRLQDFIASNTCLKTELEEASSFGFNKNLDAYYEENTLKEILLARRFVRQNPPVTPGQAMVVAALLHILHGNRPYALSRRSHPVVPYAPQGEFVYKSLMNNLLDKVRKTLSAPLPEGFVEGKIFQQDCTRLWPLQINDLDAVITSPPFFDSTRFYLANWIRLWFAGWSEPEFKTQVNSFIEEKQKKDFRVYESIFRQARERLKKDGVLVLHLGKSHKCDMAQALQKIGKRWFRVADLFDENVEHCESHGIRDKGTVTSHQYLVLQ